MKDFLVIILTWMIMTAVMLIPMYGVWNFAIVPIFEQPELPLFGAISLAAMFALLTPVRS